MGIYVIKEVQSLNDDRTATMTVSGSLASAKRCATRSQSSQGTVLKIENIGGVLISYKKDGKWFDPPIILNYMGV